MMIYGLHVLSPESLSFLLGGLSMAIAIYMFSETKR